MLFWNPFPWTNSPVPPQNTPSAFWPWWKPGLPEDSTSLASPQGGAVQSSTGLFPFLVLFLCLRCLLLSFLTGSLMGSSFSLCSWNVGVCWLWPLAFFFFPQSSLWPHYTFPVASVAPTYSLLGHIYLLSCPSDHLHMVTVQIPHKQNVQSVTPHFITNLLFLLLSGSVSDITSFYQLANQKPGSEPWLPQFFAFSLLFLCLYMLLSSVCSHVLLWNLSTPLSPSCLFSLPFIISTSSFLLIFSTSLFPLPLHSLFSGSPQPWLPSCESWLCPWSSSFREFQFEWDSLRWEYHF